MTLFPISEIREHPDGKTCKLCAFLIRIRYHDKNYFKCRLKGDTRSEATDIRLKDPACNRYQDEIFKYQVYHKRQGGKP